VLSLLFRDIVFKRRRQVRHGGISSSLAIFIVIGGVVSHVFDSIPRKGEYQGLLRGGQSLIRYKAHLI
jgi:hypothetical protein